MPAPGWYPDPDGTPERLRFWDGRAWTGRTSGGPRTPGRTGLRRWWLVGVVVLVVAGLVAGAVLQLPRLQQALPEPRSTVVGGDDSSPTPSPFPSASTASPTGTPSSGELQPCPTGLPPQLAPPPADDRVHGGPLSFAALPAPWRPVVATNRFPYSRDGSVQTQPMPEELPWQASVEVGVLELVDDPSGPDLTARLLDCVTDSDFYTSVDVRMTKQETQPLTLGSTAATRLDARLEFTHPRLRTTGSDLRIIVVDTSPVSYFFAAIPKERSDLAAQLDAATASLRLT